MLQDRFRSWVEALAPRPESLSCSSALPGVCEPDSSSMSVESRVYAPLTTGFPGDPVATSLPLVRLQGLQETESERQNSSYTSCSPRPPGPNPESARGQGSSLMSRLHLPDCAAGHMEGFLRTTHDSSSQSFMRRSIPFFIST